MFSLFIAPTIIVDSGHKNKVGTSSDAKTGSNKTNLKVGSSSNLKAGSSSNLKVSSARASHRAGRATASDHSKSKEKGDHAEHPTTPTDTQRRKGNYMSIACRILLTLLHQKAAHVFKFLLYIC